MNIFYIDGEFVPADSATVPATDLAVLRGYGVFDFLRTYGGRPFKLDEHLQRLEKSAAMIGMQLPWPRAELAEITLETLRRNPYDESNVRIVVTGGVSDDFITPRDTPRLLVMVTPLHRLPDEWYSDGVKVTTTLTERYYPTAKTINYIPAILARQRAQAEGAVEAIYVSRDDDVLEGTTTNIFAFFGDKLLSPGEGVLIGITRQVILDVVKGAFEAELTRISRTQLLQADEIFITASNKEIVPVIQVDDQTIGDGKPGPNTRRVMALFREYTHQFARVNGQG